MNLKYLMVKLSQNYLQSLKYKNKHYNKKNIKINENKNK